MFNSILQPFRHFHLFAILEEFTHSHLPLDRCLEHYCREHKSLGSKDRAFIAETAYALVRWRGLLDALGAKSWPERLALKDEIHKKHPDLPPHIQASCPKILWQRLESQYGDQALEIALACNTQAPLTLRVNPLKISREELIERIGGTPTKQSPYGITLPRRINVWNLPEYREGFFEVQDEASQLVAQCMEVQPGDRVLDYCAGSGGKSLAFAHRLAGKGQIFLHDTRTHALTEARKRFNRAGIQNVQFGGQIPKGVEWILVDVPCSGSGTLRRNPDLKWRFSEQWLAELVALQGAIVEKAMAYAGPKTKMIYATCSILQEENRGTPLFASLPTIGGMDGLYAGLIDC